MLRVGTILNGRYEIISAIGSGGMSFVYKAKDMTLKRLVAIKVLKEEYSRDPGIVAKFSREAEAAGGLSHPNVVSVYDVGEQFGTYYIVMELVEGFTLKKYIEKKGQMSQHDAVQVTMQVARGLNAAHEQGIIHRDVKPQNIMVSRDGKIKVTDFGIARINDSQTSGANTMGSVHYISPEQARGGVCDERSDIYSLGITLYEMVTGRVPFEGESTVEVAIKHIKEPITPPSTYEPDINPNLEKIILKCTQKKPDYRYRSMSALLDDLKRLLATPYEDFVIMPAMSEVGATKIMNKEEAEEIRLATAGRKERTDAKAAAALLAAEKSSKKNADQVKLRTEPIREKKKNLLSEEDIAAEEKAQKVEKTLNYIMIGIAMLILIVLIAIVFRACSIFKKPASTASSSSTQTTEAQPTSTTAEETTTEPETTKAEEVKVPNLIGQDYMAAQEQLQSLQLTVAFEAETTGDYPEFTIFRQSHEEGTMVPKGSEITLWVAIPTDTDVLIPNSIAGKSIAEATEILAKEGLRVSDQYSYVHSKIAKGLVCDSNPTMGKVVEKGSQLTLVISLGPENGTVPSVLGRNETEARSALANAGFDLNRVYTDSNTIYSEAYAAGTVARIYTFDGDLSEGSTLSFSTDIYLTLSHGATFNVDPSSFLGRTDIDAAVNELQTLGLKVTTVAEPQSTYPNGQICWLTVNPDSEGVTAAHVFNKGDTIYLHYSTYEEPTTEPETTTTEEATEAPTEPVTEAPTEPVTEPVTEEETSTEGEQGETIRIDPNVYYGRTDVDAVTAELQALGFIVEIKSEPLSSYPKDQICWLSTSENDGDITADVALPVGSTIWVHVSAKVE